MKKVELKVVSSTICVEFKPSTMEYKEFGILPVSNRKIRASHVKTLEESFKRFGTGGAVIIVLKTKIYGKIQYLIADGQHKTAAATNLNLPLNVLVIALKEDTELNVTKYVAELNNTAKRWNTNDYLEIFTKNNLPDYAFLLEKKKQTGLTITDLGYIYLGDGTQLKRFKSGEIQIMDIEDSDKLLDAVLKIKSVVPDKSFVRRTLYRTFRLAKDYDKLAEAIKNAANTELSGGGFSENEVEFGKEMTKIYNKAFK